MQLRVTEDAPARLSYPYTDRLEPGDTFEVDDEKGAALLEVHDYLEEGDGDGDSASESGGSDGEDGWPDDHRDDFTALEGVGPSRAGDLHDDGYDTYDDLREASPEDIAETDGVTEANAESWQDELAEDSEYAEDISA